MQCRGVLFLLMGAGLLRPSCPRMWKQSKDSADELGLLLMWTPLRLLCAHELMIDRVLREYAVMLT